MDDIQLKALDGLVELWSDTFCGEAYRIEDKELSAYQLKPFVKAALAEPGSRVHKYISKYMTDRPRMVKAWAIYGQLPAEARQVEMNLRRGKLKDRLYLFNIIFYNFAVIYIITGISAVEAERRLKEHFASVLSSMSLDELVSGPDTGERLDEISVHTWLSLAPLFPGSIAGADRHLKSVLVSRLKTVSGAEKVSPGVTYYEQDLRVALWKCYSAGGQYLYEALKYFLGKPGTTTEQMTTEQMVMVRQMLEGQEAKLLRAMLLSVVRKAVADLPDIADTISDQRGQEEYLQELNSQRRNQDERLQSIFVRDEAVLENVEAKQDELQEKLSHDEIVELLRKEGINKDDLTDKMWRVIFRLNDAFNEGAEIGSKKGLSLDAYFGADSAATRKQLSRLRDRVTRLKAKKPQS